MHWPNVAHLDSAGLQLRCPPADPLHISLALETAIDHIHDAVLITEAEPSHGPGGPRIVFVNPAFERMTGFTAEEAIGRTPRILQGTDSDPATLRRISAAIQAWRPITVTLLNYRKDGTPFWVELAITPVADDRGWFTHWVAVQREATERVERERTLARELRFNRAVLDSLATSTCVISRAGEITMTNECWERSARENGGTLRACGVGADYLAAAAESTHGPAIVDGIRAVLAGEQPEHELLYRCDTPTEARFFHLNVVPLASDGGGAVISHVDVTSRILAERQLAVLALQQAALRHVATAIAHGADPQTIAQLVSVEIRPVTNATVATVYEFSGDDHAIVLAASAEGGFAPAAGTQVALERAPDLARARETGTPILTSGAPGQGWSLHVPLEVGDRRWGAITLTGSGPCDEPEAVRALVGPFAELLSAGVDRHEARLALERLAASDALTGLANHRSAQERLREEVGRAHRHERPLSLAIVDVDHFRSVNETLGHQGGDEVLREVAERLRSVTRSDDVLARIGGDEFALIMPETDRLTAFAVLERARLAVAGPPLASGASVTVSAGICDLEHASSPEGLLELADGALYWSKTHGRDTTWIYDPQIVEQLSAQARADHLERSRALTGLRALARAIDAKDPSTHEHSGRVAGLATALAVELGWTVDRITLLAEAALVHDVGKIGVPDAVLLKPGRLDESEYAVVRQHAELGARIVEDVLSEEQVSWVRHHHERPDGAGYPDGLAADAIPDGACLIALADCFDVMTVSRPYQAPKPVDVAVAECRELAGRQFCPESVSALEILHATGQLDAHLALEPQGGPRPATGPQP